MAGWYLMPHNYHLVLHFWWSHHCPCCQSHHRQSHDRQSHDHQNCDRRRHHHSRPSRNHGLPNCNCCHHAWHWVVVVMHYQHSLSCVLVRHWWWCPRPPLRSCAVSPGLSRLYAGGESTDGAFHKGRCPRGLSCRQTTQGSQIATQVQHGVESCTEKGAHTHFFPTTYCQSQCQCHMQWLWQSDECLRWWWMYPRCLGQTRSWTYWRHWGGWVSHVSGGGTKSHPCKVSCRSCPCEDLSHGSHSWPCNSHLQTTLLSYSNDGSICWSCNVWIHCWWTFVSTSVLQAPPCHHYIMAAPAVEPLQLLQQPLCFLQHLRQLVLAVLATALEKGKNDKKLFNQIPTLQKCFTCNGSYLLWAPLSSMSSLYLRSLPHMRWIVAFLPHGLGEIKSGKYCSLILNK